MSELSSMTTDKEEGRCRMIYGQLNNASAKDVREVNMNAVKLLNKKYSIDIGLFAKLRHNWGAGGVQHNLGSWLDSREKIKFKSMHNTDNPDTSTYQSGGIGGIIRDTMAQ